MHQPSWDFLYKVLTFSGELPVISKGYAHDTELS
jgi:hypothetical protein